MLIRVRLEHKVKSQEEIFTEWLIAFVICDVLGESAPPAKHLSVTAYLSALANNFYEVLRRSYWQNLYTN